jgi:hypothetical protein
MTVDTAHGRLRNVPQAEEKEYETDPCELPSASPSEASSILTDGILDSEAWNGDSDVDVNVRLVRQVGIRAVGS